MMKMVIEGIMDGNLPWGLILVGVFIAIVVELVGIPVLPFAIGVYLPVQLNACIMVGGIVRWFFDKIKNEEQRKASVNNGVLFCSGMIAGEGLVGILLAVFAIFGIDKVIDLSKYINLPAPLASLSGLVVFALVILTLVLFSYKKNRKA